MNMITIDPGLREMGVAGWKGGQLETCTLLRGEQDTSIRDVPASQKMALEFSGWLRGVLDVEDPRSYAGKFVHEKMVHYSSNPQANVDDLFQLVGINHACLAPYQEAEVKAVTPGQWSNQVPKKINHKRLRVRLNEKEEARLDKDLESIRSSDQEHVLDAICIGLYNLNRLHRQ